MYLNPSPRVQEMKARLEAFMDAHIYPNEARYYREAEEQGPWKVHAIVEALKPEARAAGLWKLFLPESEYAPGLTHLQYASRCVIIGRSHLARGGVTFSW